MPQPGTLKRIVWRMPGWQMFLAQLHDELGLTQWDDALIDVALGEVEEQLRVIVGDLPRDEVAKRMVISNYLSDIKNAPTVDAVGAGLKLADEYARP